LKKKYTGGKVKLEERLWTKEGLPSPPIAKRDITAKGNICGKLILSAKRVPGKEELPIVASSPLEGKGIQGRTRGGNPPKAGLVRHGCQELKFTG